MDDGPLVVDTDLLIDFLRDSGPGADLVEGWLRAARLRVAAVSAYELRLGADFLRRETPITRLIADRTLPLDLPAALRAGPSPRRSGREGRPSASATRSSAAAACASASRSRRGTSRTSRVSRGWCSPISPRDPRLDRQWPRTSSVTAQASRATTPQAPVLADGRPGQLVVDGDGEAVVEARRDGWRHHATRVDQDELRAVLGAPLGLRGLAPRVAVTEEAAEAGQGTA